MDKLEDTIRKFLEETYGPKFPGYLSLWVKQTKKTRYFSSGQIDVLAYAALEQSQRGCDVYVALGTQQAALDSKQRGVAKTVLALPGFFADIDFAESKKSGKNYPPNEAKALDVLSQFRFPPTAIIRTGNGLHVHWHFKSLLILKTAEERDRAIALAKAFQRALLEHFRAHGYEIDSVGDLARNYRLPGTENHKSRPPKPVTQIEEHPENALDPADVEEFVKSRNSPSEDKRRSNEKRPMADHKAIIEGCSWYRERVVEGAATADEPTWYAGASITARCQDGEKRFHEYSAGYEGYTREEAAKKLERAREEAGPRTCKYIQSDLGYDGCTKCSHWGLITSPIQLGQPRRPRYEPGRVGPIPIGYTKTGLFAFRDQRRRIIVQMNANQLFAYQCQLGLADSSFWRGQFPTSQKGREYDFMAAGEALVSACKDAGPFNPLDVRGRGVWLEDGEMIVNLGQPVKTSGRHCYLCFESIKLPAGVHFEADRLLEFLRLFKWRNPQDAVLLFGWLAIAPICGVLRWRPHVFVYGPPRCGKTTIHTLAAEILQPLVVSADGQSSEAGIRQTLGPDSLPVIIDEFESDHRGGSLRAVIRLARSASSADTPVLRGTPEGKAMQFSLRITFFFCAVNPAGLSPADESRIALLELLMHDNDRGVAKRIAAEDRFFRGKGPSWCGYMVSHASDVAAAVDTFEEHVVGQDRRHRQNMSILLAGAFVALRGRPPSANEAEAWATEYAPTVELHAENLDRDDARECLDHLFAHPIEGYTLGHWVALAYQESSGGEYRTADMARRITRIFDILIVEAGENCGFLIRNGSPAIERVFERTRWEGQGWTRALKKLPGAFSPKNPVYFPNTGGKSRCTGLPLDLLPDPFDMPGDGEDRF